MRDLQKTKSQLIAELDQLRVELDGLRAQGFSNTRECLKQYQDLYLNSNEAVCRHALDSRVLDCNNGMRIFSAIVKRRSAA